MSTHNRFLLAAVATLALAVSAALLLIGGVQAQVYDSSGQLISTTTSPQSMTGTSTNSSDLSNQNMTGTGTTSFIPQPSAIPQQITGATSTNDIIGGLSGTGALALTQNDAATSTMAPTPSGVSATVTQNATGNVAGAAPTSILPLVYPEMGTTPAPMLVDIGSNGNVLLRGTSVMGSDPNTGTLFLSSWGGVWRVRLAPGAEVISSTSDFSSIAAGHFVGLEGVIARDQAFTIDATLVRNWTTNPYVAPAQTPPPETSTPENGDASGTFLEGSGTTSPEAIAE